MVVRFERLLLMAAALVVVAGCVSSVKVGPESVAGQTPDGTVEMNQVQAAFIGSAGGGTGTLHFRGRAYPFTVGGLGVGGIGASTIDACGEVYKLSSGAQFPGAYGEAQYGYALGVINVAAIFGCRTKLVSSCT